uniref:Uncharacterized protein n=1 Tax=viral metagenome TaxID=1070528 RepID=A0A6C0JAT8_9ZZZZ
MDIKEDEEENLWSRKIFDFSGIADRLDLVADNTCSWLEISLILTSGIGFMMFSLILIYIVYRLSTKG